MITSDDGRQPRNRRWALVVVPAAAAGLTALAACGSSGGAATSSPPANPSASASASAAAAAEGLKTAKVGSATVLTDAKGFTLYSFAPDTATKSACNGACATSWPPEKAPATVKSPYTAIKRSDGSMQLAFHGHPLYTFTGDTAAGQANGNGVNAFGGLWNDVPASGGAAPSGSSAPAGGGY